MVEVDYHRGPGDRQLYRQELLHRDDDHRVTLFRLPSRAAPMELAPGVVLEEGAALLWFTFPDRPWEVAAVYDADGELQGHYTNLIAPAPLEGERWEIEDLWLDLWQPAGGGEPRLLDEDELDRAEEEGWIEVEAARGVRELGNRLLERARAGDWPPRPVEETPLSAARALRLRRDRPGLFHANLFLTRTVAYSLYLLAAVALTTLVYAVVTSTPVEQAAARPWWLAALAAEAVVLLPLAAAGRLPATRWPRARSAFTEHSLFLAALACGVAVIFLYDERQWRLALSAIYGVVAVFSGVFAGCRAWFDRQVPGYALLGLGVSLVALVLLL